jgi:hypothetical protein
MQDDLACLLMLLYQKNNGSSPAIARSSDMNQTVNFSAQGKVGDTRR